MQGDPKASAAFATLHVLEHPLIQHKLSHMRDKNTPTILFRQLLREISLLMGYEISRSLPLTVKTVETPMATTDVRVIKGKKVCVVPILRAGTGMAEGLLELMPSARVGSIGLYRDEETKYPVEYLVKIPNTEDRLFILADPMLATGHSAVHAVDILKKNGVRDKDIIFLALVFGLSCLGSTSITCLFLMLLGFAVVAFSLVESLVAGFENLLFVFMIVSEIALINNSIEDIESSFPGIM